MKHEIELHPFQVPNFVRQVLPARPKHDGIQELPAIPLCELSVETPEALCEEFRREVFAKANKEPTAGINGAAKPSTVE